MNPYEPPQTTRGLVPASVPRRDRGVLSIWITATACVVIYLVALLLSPQLWAALSPRIGTRGFASLFLMILLGSYKYQPRRIALLLPALMTFVQAYLNVLDLSRSGTVTVVVDPLKDRLHEAWFWTVGLPAIVGIYLLVVAFRADGPWYWWQGDHPNHSQRSAIEVLPKEPAESDHGSDATESTTR